MTHSLADIAVIIPTYNRCQFLERSICSVLNQTIPVAEIIVVDDGSTDATQAYVQQAFPQVTLLTQDNAGVSSARNRGIEQTDCEWIAFLDSDDAWLPFKIEKQLEQLAQTEGAQVCHTEELWIRNEKAVKVPTKFKKQGGWIFEQSLQHCALSPSTTLINRTVFDEVGNFDPSLPVCEDYDLWLRITSTRPVALVEEPCIQKYGGHADQLSMSIWGLDRFRVLALHQFIQKNAETLSAAQLEAARAALRIMAEIVIAGALKHGNTEIEQNFSDILKFY